MTLDLSLVALIDSAVFTFRVLAGAMSCIALLIYFRQRAGDERPPYDRHRNDHAWLWAHAGMLLGSIGFVTLDLEYLDLTGAHIENLVKALVWWCWSTAAVIRISAKVLRPRFVFHGATIFVAFGLLITLIQGG